MKKITLLLCVLLLSFAGCKEPKKEGGAIPNPDQQPIPPPNHEPGIDSLSYPSDGIEDSPRGTATKRD